VKTYDGIGPADANGFTSGRQWRGSSDSRRGDTAPPRDCAEDRGGGCHRAGQSCSRRAELPTYLSMESWRKSALLYARVRSFGSYWPAYRAAVCHACARRGNASSESTARQTSRHTRGLGISLRGRVPRNVTYLFSYRCSNPGSPVLSAIAEPSGRIRPQGRDHGHCGPPQMGCDESGRESGLCPAARSRICGCGQIPQHLNERCP
jgi:hypothetical protein